MSIECEVVIGKRTTVVEIMKERKTDLALLTETKRRLTGAMDVDKYNLIYSGVENARRQWQELTFLRLL